MAPATQNPAAGFSKSESRVPDCCRLALEVDAAGLLEEFSPELWPDGEFRDTANRSRYFLFGHPEPDTPDEPLPVLDKLPYTQRVIETLPGNVRRAHFSLLPATSALSVHKDGSNRFELFDRTLRLHLPVLTNDASSMFVNERFYTMGIGEVWQMNNFCRHSAINNHPHRDRIHLVVDMEPDAELLRLLGEADPNSGYLDVETYQQLHPPVAFRVRIRDGIRRRAQYFSKPMPRQTPQRITAALDVAKRTLKLRCSEAKYHHLGRRDSETFDQVEKFCMFIGYPRSGHTLVAAVLDAHPDAVCSIEAEVPMHLRRGYSRDQIYARILQRGKAFSRSGASVHGFDYRVKGEWQGRFRTLRVIGDKRGGQAARVFSADPGLIQQLRDTVGVPLRIIHVVRNPFDNIATIERRGRRSMQDSIEYYFSMCDAVAALRPLFDDDEFMTLKHEDIIADPAAGFRRLFEFLPLQTEGEFLQNCTEIVIKAPHESRNEYPWTTEHKDLVNDKIEQNPYLFGYRFDE